MTKAAAAQNQTGVIVIEAEDIIASGYIVEDRDIASGGSVVSLLGSGATQGVLEYAFDGPKGVYNLAITAHDEDDGQSSFQVLINGEVVRTIHLNADLPGAVTHENRVVFTLEELELDAGDLIEIRAQQDDDEWVRIDKLELVPAPPPEAVISVEAEDIIASGYIVENRDIASGDAVVSLLGSGATTGELEYAFEGANGVYNIAITTHDEDDGQSSFQVLVNGEIIETIHPDADLPGAVTNENRIIVNLDGIELNTGDLIEIRAQQDNDEWVRIDKIDFIPDGGIETMTTEIESLELDGFQLEERDDASGGILVKTIDVGTATGTFNGDAGYYNIDIGYFDESDGQATWGFFVNGVNVRSWQGYFGDRALGEVAEETITGIWLEPGDVITLQGTSGEEELARLDYMSVTPTDAPAAALGVGVNEAEALDLQGFNVQSDSNASGGAVVTGDNGKMTGTFLGDDGRYDLTLDVTENSTELYDVLINGEVVARLGDTQDDDTPYTVSLDLTKGDSITIQSPTAAIQSFGALARAANTSNSIDTVALEVNKDYSGSSTSVYFGDLGVLSVPKQGYFGTGIQIDLASNVAERIYAHQQSILPYGNSITYGVNGDDGGKYAGGYRGLFWKGLDDPNDIRFLGDFQFNKISDSGFDPDHHGHRGLTSGQAISGHTSTLGGESFVTPALGTFIANNAAVGEDAVVFLLLGTNDILTYVSVSQFAANLKTVIKAFHAHNPFVEVIVGEIPPLDDDQGSHSALWNGATAAVATFNSALAQAVTELNNQDNINVSIALFDFSTNSNLSANPDLGSDGIHPTPAGYQVMANGWNDAFFHKTSISSSVKNVTGSNGDDLIYGDELNNVLSGLEGNDKIYGRGGEDTLISSTGNISKYINAGSAYLNGGAGKDKIYTGFGVDTVKGGSEDDSIYVDCTHAQFGAVDLFHNIDGGDGSDTLYFTDIDDNRASALVSELQSELPSLLSGSSQITLNSIGAVTVASIGHYVIEADSRTYDVKLNSDGTVTVSDGFSSIQSSSATAEDKVSRALVPTTEDGDEFYLTTSVESSAPSIAPTTISAPLQSDLLDPARIFDQDIYIEEGQDYWTIDPSDYGTVV